MQGEDGNQKLSPQHKSKYFFTACIDGVEEEFSKAYSIKQREKWRQRYGTLQGYQDKTTYNEILNSTVQ